MIIFFANSSSRPYLEREERINIHENTKWGLLFSYKDIKKGVYTRLIECLSKDKKE